MDPPLRPWHRVAVGRDEAALIRQARRGSADAVEALVRRHWADAHRAAFLIVQDAAAAEDIAQESMLAAVRALDRFDRRRPFRPPDRRQPLTGLGARAPAPRRGERRGR